jgi:pimeloyl-ACP methyl ester carboxylesterase
VAAGHPVLAVDLPGGGLRSRDPQAFRSGDPARLAAEVSPLGALSAADVAAVAVAAVRELAGAHGPVVVVGHSLAGVVVHHVGEAVPELVRSLVYLGALAPAPGGTVFADAAGPAFADSLFLRLPVSDPAATGAVRIDWASEDAEYRATARACFYGDVPDDVAAAATRMLTPDVPARLYSDPVALTAERWGSLPRTWLVTTADRAVPPAAQEASIAALDAAFPEHPFARAELATSHSPFLSAPGALADALHAAAG